MRALHSADILDLSTYQLIVNPLVTQNITVTASPGAGFTGVGSGGTSSGTNVTNGPQNYQPSVRLGNWDNFHWGAQKNNFGGDFNVDNSHTSSFTVWGNAAAGLTASGALAQSYNNTGNTSYITVYAAKGDFQSASNLAQQNCASAATLAQAHNGGGDATKGFIELAGIAGGFIYGAAAISAGAVLLARTLGTSNAGWQDLGKGVAAVVAATTALYTRDANINAALNDLALSAYKISADYRNGFTDPPGNQSQPKTATSLTADDFGFAAAIGKVSLPAASTGSTSHFEDKVNHPAASGALLVSPRHQALVYDHVLFS